MNLSFKRPIFVIIAVFALLLVPFSVFDDNVDAVGEPKVTINLNQIKQSAYVAPGQDGVVTFTGMVYAEIPWAPNIQYLVVTLSAQCSDFPVSVPPSLVFSKTQTEQSFTISVQVPIGTSAVEDYTLYVNGTWSYSPGVIHGDCEDATAVICVKQYYDLDLGSDDPLAECKRPGSAVLLLQVTNTGNGQDEIGLELDDQGDLSDAGIDVILTDDSIILGPRETEEVKILVEVSDRARINTVEVSVSADSVTAHSLGEISNRETFVFYLEVVRELSQPEESGPGPGTGNETEPTPGEQNPEQPPEGTPVETTTGEGNASTGSNITGGQGSNVLPTILITAFVLTVIAAIISYIFIRRRGGKKRSGF